MLTIRVVGGIAAEVDGAPVDLGTATRARALLAWLALHPGMHARGDLAARLRPDVSDESARKSLRQAVWALRGALGEAADALVADRDRVGLSDDPSRVATDIATARAARDAGDLAGAVAVAGAGELLAGLDEEWVEAERARHREEVRGMLGALASAAAEAGDVPAAIAWARRRVADDPHSEIAARALIGLLARAGDRAGAVAAMDDLRTRLRRDLGIVPSAETREMVAEVRAGGPGATTGAGSSPTPLPAPLDRRGPFVGRADALAVLQAAWRDAASGATRIAVVAGEPGIGKTRLASALAAQVHGRGAAVLYGRSDEDAPVPHQPFVEALERHLRALPSAERDALIGRRRPDLARVLPAVEPDPAAVAPDDAGTGRYRAFEAVRGVLEGIAAGRPTLLVLDDLHWIDPAGLQMLRHLTRMTGGARLLVVGTYRDTEVGRAHPLAAALSDIRRDQPLVSVPLTGLDEGEVADLVGSHGGPVADAARLGRRARGNPLLLGELVRATADGGDAGAAVPERVVELVGQRVDRLGDDVAATLETAALLGTEFPLDLLEELHGPAALAAVERAREAGLVAEADPATGRHAFGHALVAEALADRLSPPLRRRRHRRIAEVVVPRAERDPDTHAAEAARHLQAALPDADPEAAVRWSMAAAARARALLADNEAAAHLARALAALPAGDPRRAGMLVALGDATGRAGDRAASRAAFAEAGDLARAAGDAPLEARAALGRGGLGTVIGPCDPGVAGALEGALASVGGTDPDLRARLLGRLAIELYYADRPRADALSAEAVAVARRTGDPGALAAALNARRVAIWDIDHAEERLAVATEMTAAATRAGDAATALQGRAWRVVDLMELARLDEVRAEVEAYGAGADALGLPHYRWWTPLWRGTLALLEGDRDAAARLGAEALALGRRADDPNVRLHVLIQEVQALIDTGRFDGFDRDFVDRGVADSPAAWAWKTWLAWVEAGLGHRAEAEALVDDLARDDFAAVRLDANWHAVGDLAEALAVLGPAQAARAARLRRMLAPYAGLVGVVGRAAACYGPLDHHLGLLATVEGDHAGAVCHFEEALRICGRIGAVPRSAQVRARLAEARAALSR
ncbi:ATP-binding protein [Miltoncostaea oceani]|uniref:ATP-binding protein n=1 Tax=Miltoncostaea oceani TaxID=2843216 RepID=UPI001C3C9675|nr:AAA family ATPase [Miltoncostaea oceani]